MIDTELAIQIREITEKKVKEWVNLNSDEGGIASRKNFSAEQLNDMAILAQHIAILVVMEYDRIKSNQDVR